MLTDTLLLITLRWQLAWNSFRGRSLIRRILIIAFFGWVGAATDTRTDLYSAGVIFHEMLDVPLSS